MPKAWPSSPRGTRTGELERHIFEALHLELNGNYPLVALIDRTGAIRYHSEGYKIGVIEQVLKAARR